MKVFGKNVVKELLNNPEKVKKIYLTNNFKDQDIIKLIKDKHIQYEPMNKSVMDHEEEHNQGIMAIIDDFSYTNYEDMMHDKVVVVLDHLEDPHNFGAIIRTCEAAGIKSIIIPKDRSVDVTPTVMKVSSGALSYVNIARVNNLNNVIDKFKKNGYFIYGAEANGKDYHQIDYAFPIVIIIGSEGFGLTNIVQKACDEIVSLPMNGHVNSLNASVAAGIIIYDIIGR
jgi:23S rRNA (guanosine2251-2'-O)-methyltransferase